MPCMNRDEKNIKKILANQIGVYKKDHPEYSLYQTYIYFPLEQALHPIKRSIWVFKNTHAIILFLHMSSHLIHVFLL